MRRSGAGARSSARPLPAVCAAAGPSRETKWYLDDVFIRIQGVQHYPWRAVDQGSVVLDILVQPRRDAKAAERFLRRLLKGLQYVPRVIVTDKLRSYGVAQRKLLPNAEHRQSKYLNNRAETRIVGHAAASARCNDSNRLSRRTTSSPRMHFIYGHSHPLRHRLAASAYRALRTEAFNVWQQDTCVRNAA
jgi:putative transposase